MGLRPERPVRVTIGGNVRSQVLDSDHVIIRATGQEVLGDAVTSPNEHARVQIVRAGEFLQLERDVRAVDDTTVIRGLPLEAEDNVIANGEGVTVKGNAVIDKSTDLAHAVLGKHALFIGLEASNRILIENGRAEHRADIGRSEREVRRTTAATNRNVIRTTNEFGVEAANALLLITSVSDGRGPSADVTGLKSRLDDFTDDLTVDLLLQFITDNIDEFTTDIDTVHRRHVFFEFHRPVRAELPGFSSDGFLDHLDADHRHILTKLPPFGIGGFSALAGRVEDVRIGIRVGIGVRGIGGRRSHTSTGEGTPSGGGFTAESRSFSRSTGERNIDEVVTGFETLRAFAALAIDIIHGTERKSEANGTVHRLNADNFIRDEIRERTTQGGDDDRRHPGIALSIVTSDTEDTTRTGRGSPDRFHEFLLTHLPLKFSGGGFEDHGGVHQNGWIRDTGKSFAFEQGLPPLHTELTIVGREIRLNHFI